MQKQLTWGFWLRVAHEVTVKLSARAVVTEASGSISRTHIWLLTGLSFLLAVGWKLHFLIMWASP